MSKKLALPELPNLVLILAPISLLPLPIYISGKVKILLFM